MIRPIGELKTLRFYWIAHIFKCDAIWLMANQAMCEWGHAVCRPISDIHSIKIIEFFLKTYNWNLQSIRLRKEMCYKTGSPTHIEIIENNNLGKPMF